MSEAKEKEDQLELDLGIDEITEDAVEEIVVADDEEVEVSKEDSSKPNLSVQDGITELKAQLDRERLARIDAENKAKEAAQQALRARSEVDDTNLHLVNSAINEVKRENLWYKNAIREAMERGDFERATDYQMEMANNISKLNKLEEGKVAMESRPRHTEQATNDPVEMFAAQLSPRSADWVRRNPQCVTDPRLQQKMIAAHNLAVADGYAPDTDDYFAFVEDTLKINRKVETAFDDTMSSASKPTQRRSSPPAAAPVSRTPTTGSGPRSNAITLSSAEVEAARISGITPKQYYENKMREKRRNQN